MKTQCGIWVDTKQAHLVFKKGESVERSTVESDVENKVHHWDDANTGTFKSSTHHHQNDEKKYGERKKHQLSAYVESITDQLTGVDEIFVFGPAETKNLLKDKILAEPLLKDKLMAVETADKMTENQLIEKVRDFFKA